MTISVGIRKRLLQALLGASVTFTAAMVSQGLAAQELLKAIEPGTGYSRLKQWAVEHGLVFEKFTKDTLVILGSYRENDDTKPYGIHLLARFCAGDDYSGRAYSITLQQVADIDNQRDAIPVHEIFTKHRKYIDVLAGKTTDDGLFAGDYKIRRERTSEWKGLAAVGTAADKSTWEVGLYAQGSRMLVQVTRGKDEICK